MAIYQRLCHHQKFVCISLIPYFLLFGHRISVCSKKSEPECELNCYRVYHLSTLTTLKEEEKGRNEIGKYAFSSRSLVVREKKLLRISLKTISRVAASTSLFDYW